MKVWPHQQALQDVTLGGQRQGKSKRLADLLAEAGRAPKPTSLFDAAKLMGMDFAGQEARVLAIDESTHILDALTYSTYTARTTGRNFQWPKAKTLEEYPAHELIMEMLRRGYAVMKAPEGGRPETLK